jgi:micrococcal nuclease
VVVLAGCASTASTAPIPGTSSAEAPAIGSEDNIVDAVDVPGVRAQVERVIDGDSLDLRIDGELEETRLIGVNAPEPDECLADEARDRLTDLVTGTDVFVVTAGRDDFGRVLAVVRTADTYVNLELVREGLAVARDQSGHPDAGRFEDAEAEARAIPLGIWAPGACGGSTDASIEIVGVEADAEGPDNENPNGEWIELRNTSSQPVDLTGWVVRDESTRHRYAFADEVVIAAGASLRLFSGTGTDTATERYWGKEGESVWNNDGDTVFVLDASGSTVASFPY